MLRSTFYLSNSHYSEKGSVNQNSTRLQNSKQSYSEKQVSNAKHRLNTVTNTNISQALSTAPQETAYFTTLDLQYAYSQLKLHSDTASRCNFNIVSERYDWHISL